MMKDWKGFIGRFLTIFGAALIVLNALDYLAGTSFVFANAYLYGILMVVIGIPLRAKKKKTAKKPVKEKPAKTQKK